MAGFLGASGIDPCRVRLFRLNGPSPVSNILMAGVAPFLWTVFGLRGQWVVGVVLS